MNEDRLRWITRPPTLDAFTIGARFAQTPTGLLITLHAAGACDRKRGAIWTYNETIGVDEGRYSAADLIHHLALVAIQDRPSTDLALTRGLCGSGWEQPELPF